MFNRTRSRTKHSNFFRLVLGIAVLALVLTPGIGQASFLVPQTHHPGEFFEKYAEPLPNFGAVDDDNNPATPPVNARVTGTPLTVTYEEFRQRVLPETFYTGGGPLALPPLVSPFVNGTLVWGYNVGGAGALFPGVTIEAQRGTDTQVTYINNLTGVGASAGPELQPLLSIDQTIHWANPTEVPGPPVSRLELPPFIGPQPVVSHLHGGEVPSSFDGTPDQWFTESGIQGPGYRSMTLPDGSVPPANSAIYNYPNDQEATTLWFHDHALGITRINVYAGVAAYYFLRDGFDNGQFEIPGGNSLGLPGTTDPAREVEFVIQDRMFDIVGNLLFPDGLPFFTPNAQHPFWNPEFLGDVSVVNGRSWPYLAVDAQRYRIRFLNGSNARFYNLSLASTGKGKKVKAPPMWVIGTDGGLLDEPVMTSELLIAPGERYDVIIDFAGTEGTTFVMQNDAKAPYPFGETADPKTIGEIAQFRVINPVMADNTYNPDPMAPDYGGALRDNTAATPAPIKRLVNADGTLDPDVTVTKYRQLTLNEIPGPFGPLAALLNNTRWGGTREDGTPVGVNGAGPQGMTLDTGTVAGVTNYLTEFPQNGSTEVWEIINMTGDAHPIHLHLVQFQVLNRQGYNVKQYEREYLRKFPGGAAANPNSGFFIPFYGPPLAYDNSTNPDFCPTFPVPCDGVVGGPPPATLGGNPDITPFLQKSPIPPKPYEFGWKDTVIAMPKQVTRIAVRWAPQDVVVGNETPGTNYFGFDPTAIGNPADGIVEPDGVDTAGLEGGPGYVWHCHILDHEDNEMMRPYAPVNNADNVMD